MILGTYVRMRRRYDWVAIQKFYDDGHTIRECQARFGFANGAWDAAVGRGEIVPREQYHRAGHTRDDPECSRGKSHAHVLPKLAGRTKIAELWMELIRWQTELLVQ